MNSNSFAMICEQVKQAQIRELGLHNKDSVSRFLLRQSKYYEDGLLHFNRIMEKENLEYDLVRQTISLQQSDDRFSFIQYIPPAAFLAASRGTALEKCIFGAHAHETGELAMLFSIFTNLLDGILDETPEALSPKDRQFLQMMMLEQPWKDTDLPEIPVLHADNIITDMLFSVMNAIIKRVVTSKGWKESSRVKNQFCMAARYAFFSEWESTKYNSLYSAPTDVAEMENDLNNKSCNWSWVVSMAPLCIHGWPDYLEENHFHEFTRKLGVFGGWLDDISDISHDLETNKWSNVFLEIYKMTKGAYLSERDFPRILINALADESVVSRISKKGRTLYQQLVDSIRLLPFDPEPLLESIHDTVLVFLNSSVNAYQPAFAENTE